MPSRSPRPATARVAPVDHSTSKVSRGSAKPGSAGSTWAPSAANANAACATSAAISGSTAAWPSSGLKAIRRPATPSSRPRRTSPSRRQCASRGRRAARSRRAAARGRRPCGPSGRRARPGRTGWRPGRHAAERRLQAGKPAERAGIRIEPPPSVPSASGTIPEASAAELPPLDPPAVVAGFHGLRVTPVSAQSVTPFQPSSASSSCRAAPRPSAAARRRPARPRPTGWPDDRAGAAQRRPAARDQQVLDRDRHAVERSGGLAATPARLGGPRVRPRGVRVDEAERVDVPVERLDPLERGVGASTGESSRVR